MKKVVVWVCVFLALLLIGSSVAETEYTSGYFTYRIKGNGTAVITGFDWKANGNNDVYIPRMVDGYTVTEIGEYAFSNSEKAFSYDLNDTLIGAEVAVIIPDTITKISQKAFYYTKIRSANIPASVKIIEDGVFAGCRNITSFTVDSGNESYTTIEGVLYNKKDKSLIAFPTNIKQYFQSRAYSKNIFNIPEGIVSLAPYSFYDVNRTNAIIAIPRSLKMIGDYAFEYSSVSVVPASETNRYYKNNQANYVIKLPASIEEIGSFSFAYCDGINWERYDVTLDAASIRIIPEYAFYNSSIETLGLPKVIEKIGTSAFELKESGRTKLSMPDSLATIDDRAFCGVSFRVVFGSNSKLEAIGNQSFYNSVISNSEKFVLPSGLKRIGEQSLYNEASIGFIRLVVPASVKEIGDNFCDRTKITLEVEEDSYASIWATDNGYVVSNTSESDTSWLNE